MHRWGQTSSLSTQVYYLVIMLFLCVTSLIAADAIYQLVEELFNQLKVILAVKCKLGARDKFELIA